MVSIFLLVSLGSICNEWMKFSNDRKVYLYNFNLYMFGYGVDVRMLCLISIGILMSISILRFGIENCVDVYIIYVPSRMDKRERLSKC